VLDAIAFHQDILGADDPASFFTIPG
jgi:hypothetical protein